MKRPAPHGARSALLLSCLTRLPHRCGQVELFDFEDVAEDRPRSSLTYEERLEAAARRRLEGNDHFRAARFGDALARCELQVSRRHG